MIKNNFILAVVSVILAAQIAWAQVPATISYQGILTDVDGDIVADADYALAFNLYDVLSGGSSIWSESQNLTVTKGVFNVILGDVNPLDLPFDKQYWLGVSIGNDPELNPRIQFTASPYSMSSQRVAGGTNVFPSEGNVGVGIATPQQKLHVVGLARFDLPTGQINISTPGGSPGIIAFATNGHRRDIIISDEVLRLLTSSSSSPPGAANGITIRENGDVGIGTGSPTEKLTVTGSIHSTSGGFKFPDGTVQTSAATGAAGGNTLDQAYDQGGAGAGRTINADAGAVNITGSDGLTVNGKVGIGTTAQSDNLEISENKDDFVGISITNRNTGNNSSEGIYFNNEDGTIAGIRLFDDGSSSYPSWMTIFNNRPGGSIHFGTGGTSQMTLANNGNLGIGTTNPQQKLHVVGFARFDVGGGQINISTPGGNPGIIAFAKNGHRRDIVFGNNGLRLSTSSSSSAPANGINIGDDGYVGINLGFYPNNILQIKQNSATKPVADGWTTYSSKRWKTNIKPIANALVLVQRLRGVTFDWKENSKHDIGLIAEEVGEVIPEVVAYEENGIDAKSVDYARLVAVLIEGIKEQQKQINQLKERITNIEK